MQLTVPSQRNFDIYHAVATQGLSRREAAAKFSLSPTRVQQIVEQVRFYVSQFGSEDFLFFPAEQAELISLRMNYERLRHLYNHMIKAWQQSQTPYPYPGESPAAIPTPLAPPKSGGDLRLLRQAVRITMQQSQIAARITQAHLRLSALNLLPDVKPIDAMVEESDDDPPVPPTPAPLPTSAPAPATLPTPRHEDRRPARETAPPTGGCTDLEPAAASTTLPRNLDLGASASATSTSEHLANALARRQLLHQSELRSAQKQANRR